MDISWVVTQMVCYPEVEGEANVVFQVYFDVRGVEGQTDACVPSFVNLAYKPGQSFIPFSQLTNDMVIEWVKSEMGNAAVRDIEAMLQQRLEDRKNPPIIRPNLPWGQ